MLIPICALLLGFCQSAPPSTQPQAASLQEAREPSQQVIDEITRRLPRGNPIRIEDLLEGRFVDGFLLVDLAVPPDRPVVVLPLEGMSGASVEVRHRQEDFPSFNVILRRVGRTEAEIVVFVHLFVGPPEGQISLAMDVETTDGGTLNVNLMQLMPGQEEGSGVRLAISRSHPEDEQRRFNVAVEAPDFLALLREHPDLFAQYVRPMLLDMGLHEAMDPDLRPAAIQLFLSDLPVDAAARRRVEELLPELDAPEFSRRQQAQNALKELGRPAATALVHLTQERELSAEQATRVQAVLAPYQPLDPEEIAARGDDPAFLQAVAGLAGEPDDEALADLARRRLADSGARPGSTTQPPDGLGQ